MELASLFVKLFNAFLLKIYRIQSIHQIPAHVFFCFLFYIFFVQVQIFKQIFHSVFFGFFHGHFPFVQRIFRPTFDE